MTVDVQEDRAGHQYKPVPASPHAQRSATPQVLLPPTCMRLFCSYTNRLMDGVRRWMTATPPTGSRTSRIDRGTESKLKSKKPHVPRAAESMPETLPEIVVRLLDPIVKEEEEYQEYVNFSSHSASLPHGIPLWMYVDRKSTRLNSSHSGESRMPSSA